MVELASLKRPTKGKGAPPLSTRNENNLAKPASGQKVPLQLKISPELRREINDPRPKGRGIQDSASWRSSWSFR